MANDEQERQADPALKDAKIDCTVGMIARILKQNDDSTKLMILPKFNETLAPHDANVEESTSKFHIDMKTRNKEKINTIKYCEQVLLRSETEAEKESISLIDNF